MPSKIPQPTTILRLIHVNNLPVLIERGGLHAPNHVPDDGLVYKTIHNIEIQSERHNRSIPCGPGGVIHDYVSFYFGPRSPMLYQLHTGRVEGYDEGQEMLVYLASTAQTIADSGAGFVFSDGHGIAILSQWFNDLARLDAVDWAMIKERYWADTIEDMDRQRRKQAEFLVHECCDWKLIKGIGVFDDEMAERVKTILDQFQQSNHPLVKVKKRWYY